MGYITPMIDIDDIKDEFFDEIKDSDLIDAIKDRVWDDDVDPTRIFTDQQLVQRGFLPKDDEQMLDKAIMRVRREIEQGSRLVVRQVLCQILNCNQSDSIGTIIYALMQRL